MNMLALVLTYLKDKIFFGKSGSILMYHSIGRAKEFHVVNPNEFEWQMEYIAKNNFKVVSLLELIKKIKSKEKLDKNTIAITFDDGYEDNFTVAYPILRKYNFPATIFLTTSWIGNKQYINKRGINLPMLDWGQIKEMHTSGLIDFEPHTDTHPKLSQISYLDQQREVTLPKKIIEEKLSKVCRIFCYPYGDYDKEVVDIVRRGFDAALTVRRGFISVNNELFILPRNSVDSKIGEFLFRFKI